MTGEATRPEDLCPTCGGVCVMRCRCLLGDRRCGLGHEWHFCPVHGEAVLGEADHAGDTGRCDCGRA